MPELIVRFGVIRVGRDRGLELLLGVGDLAGVPENDALVEQRVGTAAAGGGASRRPPLNSVAFALAVGRLVELPLRVVDVREPVVRLGVVGLQLDGLLVGRFRLVVVLLLGCANADVVVAVVARRVATRPPCWNFAIASS